MSDSNTLTTFRNSVKHWYVLLLIGVILIACGIYAFTVPLQMYLTLSMLFSLSFLFSGISEIFFSLQNSKSLKGWGWYLVSGLFSSGIGIYLLAYPEVSANILPFIVGFTVLFRSFFLLGFSFDLKDAGIKNWGSLTITSILGIILSFLLLSNPLFAGASLVTLTGMAFIFAGIASIILSLYLKKLR